MRARFIGDPRRGGEGPSLLPFMGVTFVKGEWVGDLPGPLANKVRGNSHFEVEDGNRAVETLTVLSNATDHRASIIAELKAMGVTFAKNAKTNALEALLARHKPAAPAPAPADADEYRATLKAQLVDLGVEYEPDAPTEDLEAALDAATAPDAA